VSAVTLAEELAIRAGRAIRGKSHPWQFFTWKTTGLFEGHALATGSCGRAGSLSAACLGAATTGAL